MPKCWRRLNRLGSARPGAAGLGTAGLGKTRQGYGTTGPDRDKTLSGFFIGGDMDALDYTTLGIGYCLMAVLILLEVMDRWRR